MKVVFSSLFKQDLLDAETRYASTSTRLSDDFHDRVSQIVRTISHRQGGDHIGPHGYPCRKCRPFPYLLYYQIENDTLSFLGLVHERRHPDHLRKNFGEA